jgi:L-asparagine transporter-like permease
MMTSLQNFTEDESPFVTALNDDGLAFFPHVFNAAVIIAGFSAMTASLFGVTNLLVTLAKDKDAPAFFEKKIKKLKDLPLPSLGLATVGLIASIIASFAVPGRIYEYITTAAGLMILYNWFFIITSSLRLISSSLFQKILSWLGLLLILAAVIGTLFEKTVRPGLYISLLFVVVIAIVAFFIQKKGKQNKTAS